MKILIFKIAAIGDVVMSLPLLTYLKERYPTAHVTWVCGRPVVPLIRATNAVDQIIALDEKSLLTGNVFSRCIVLMNLWRQIGGRFYDLCITAHSDPRYRLLSLPIRCKLHRSWSQKGKRVGPLPGRYHAEEYVRLLSDLDGPHAPSVAFPKLHLPCSRPLPEKPFLVLAPGGAKNVLADDALRRWPIESYVAVAQNLANHCVPVVVVGGEEDQWVRKHFQDVVHIDWIGQWDLLELVALFSRCKLLITHDSGPLHLAKLAGCPAIALFGPTNPQEKVDPKENIKVLWGGESLACRPCYDGKKYAPCQRNECLRNISPDQVLQEIWRQLQS